jgi:hypothetical protein
MPRAQVGQKVFELFGSRLAGIRRKIQGRRGYRHSITGSLDPASDGSFTDWLVAIPGGHGPLQGLLYIAADGV